MAQIRFERTLFIFKVDMSNDDIRKDLDAIKRLGWSIEKGSHFITREPDGTLVVNLILRRVVRG